MKQVMEQVLERLKKAHAQGDLILSSSKTLKMSAQNGDLSTYNVSSSRILGVRVIKDGKVGLSYTESLDDGSLALLVEEALRNASISDPNPLEEILELAGSLEDVARYDDPAVEVSRKIEQTLELEAGVRALDPRVVAVPYNSFSESEYESHYLSSKGRWTSYADKSYAINTSAVLDEGGKKSSFYDYCVSHTFNGLEWRKVIEKAFGQALALLKERPLPTGKYAVCFSEDCLKDLMECFSSFYSAKAALDKVNPWASRIGDQVASADLTITDDPLYADAFRATRFDAEGVEASALTLVESGVLRSLCHNSVTARHFGTRTTGHAYRAPGGPLGVSGTHFVIRGKNKRPLPDRYLEVIQMDGLYSGANRVTGNFSVGVKGYLWEHGERKQVFGNVTLSGNLMELLNNVEVVGEGLCASTDRSFFSVPLVFQGLSVAGS